MRTRTGTVVALLVLATVCEKGQADAPAPAPALKQGELAIFSTAAMPDGVRVDVEQSAFIKLDANGQLVRHAVNLDYYFTFQSGRTIFASVLKSFAGEPALITCSPAQTGKVPFSQCSRWPEMRQVVMTLHALGSSDINALEGKDSVTVDRAAMGITDADIAAWVAKAAARNKVAQ